MRASGPQNGAKSGGEISSQFRAQIGSRSHPRHPSRLLRFPDARERRALGGAPASQRRRAVMVAVVCMPAATVPFVGRAHAAPRARLIDPRWAAVGASAGPDHGAWTALLRDHRRLGPDGIARLDYAGFSADDRAALNSYVASLTAIDPITLTRPAAFAYWANLYNALTVQLVLEAYPVSSIRAVRGGLFNTGPWTDDVVSVAGFSLSLDDIEHGIMRPVFEDPRIHYAVNCAALGCPNLAPAAFEPAQLDAALDALARDYVNHPRGARVDGGRLTVSSIYEWFQEDFGGNDAGVLAHLRAYAGPELTAALGGVTRISDDAYDWSLNDAGR